MTTESTSQNVSRPGTSLVPLMASALVLVGLVVAQFGRIMGWYGVGPRGAASIVLAQPIPGLDTSAGARGMVSHAGGFVVLTSEAGNEDLLVVLDQRNEELFVYKMEQQNSLQLTQRLSVSQLFVEARTRAQGRPPP